MSPPAPRTTEIFTSCVPISETNAKIALSSFQSPHTRLNVFFLTALLTDCAFPGSPSSEFLCVA